MDLCSPKTGALAIFSLMQKTSLSNSVGPNLQLNILHHCHISFRRYDFHTVAVYMYIPLSILESFQHTCVLA